MYARVILKRLTKPKTRKEIVMKTLICSLVIGVSINVGTLPAPAFDYNESIDGDIDRHGKKGSPPIFRLDVGTNVIQGSDSYSTPFNFDLDLFRFRVPPGTVLHLDSIVFEYSITGMFGQLIALGSQIGIGEGVPNQNSPILYNVGDHAYPILWLFSDGTYPFQVAPSPVTLEFFEVVNSAVDDTRPAPALLPGDYWLLPGLSWLGNDSHGAMWNYSFRLIVSQRIDGMHSTPCCPSFPHAYDQSLHSSLALVDVRLGRCVHLAARVSIREGLPLPFESPANLGGPARQFRLFGGCHRRLGFVSESKTDSEVWLCQPGSWRAILRVCRHHEEAERGVTCGLTNRGSRRAVVVVPLRGSCLLIRRCSASVAGVPALFP